MATVLWRLANDHESIRCELVVKGDGACQVRVIGMAGEIRTAVDVMPLDRVFAISQRFKRAFLNTGFREEL